MSVDVIVSLTLVGLASGWGLPRALSARWALVSALPLLNGAVLIAFVLGEDTYRDNGISRWDAYRSPGGALGPMLVLAVALTAVLAALLALAAFRGHRWLFRSVAGAAAVTGLLLVMVTIIGFSSN